MWKIFGHELELKLSNFKDKPGRRIKIYHCSICDRLLNIYMMYGGKYNKKLAMYYSDDIKCEFLFINADLNTICIKSNLAVLI